MLEFDDDEKSLAATPPSKPEAVLPCEVCEFWRGIFNDTETLLELTDDSDISSADEIAFRSHMRLVHNMVI